jgi:hypothetical protein
VKIERVTLKFMWIYRDKRYLKEHWRKNMFGGFTLPDIKLVDLNSRFFSFPYQF